MTEPFGPSSPANWVHVSGRRAGIDCVFHQEGKGKLDFKPAAAGTIRPAFDTSNGVGLHRNAKMLKRDP